jgi:hypothetical protein
MTRDLDHDWVTVTQVGIVTLGASGFAQGAAHQITSTTSTGTTTT